MLGLQRGAGSVTGVFLVGKQLLLIWHIGWNVLKTLFHVWYMKSGGPRGVEEEGVEGDWMKIVPRWALICCHVQLESHSGQLSVQPKCSFTIKSHNFLGYSFNAETLSSSDQADVNTANINKSPAASSSCSSWSTALGFESSSNHTYNPFWSFCGFLLCIRAAVTGR